MSHDTLYIGCNGTVVALRTADGTELWRTPLWGTGLFAVTSHQDVCLLHQEGRVYAGCNGLLFCLDGATGQILWQNELRGLGHNDVTLALGYTSVQFVATRARS